MAAGRVHLLYGLAGSGKTTLARALSADGKAVRFTLDEWMLRLYPGLSFESPEYGPRTEIVKELIWSQAAARAEQRGRDPRSGYAHPISRRDIEHLASIMEPPSEAEGLGIVDGR